MVEMEDMIHRNLAGEFVKSLFLLLCTMVLSNYRLKIIILLYKITALFKITLFINIMTAFLFKVIFVTFSQIKAHNSGREMLESKMGKIIQLKHLVMVREQLGSL